MSASVGTTTRRLPRQSRTPPSDPPKFRRFAWTTTGLAVLALGLCMGFDPPPGAFDPDYRVIVWGVLVLLASVGAVPISRNLLFALDMPLLLAFTLLYGPALGGGLALVASADMRELRRKITLAHAMFNRSQVALAVVSAGLVFQWLRGPGTSWPLVLITVAAATLADVLVNASLVAIAGGLKAERPWLDVFRMMRLAPTSQSFLAYFSFGLLAAPLMELFQTRGVWGLAVGVVAIVLAHQAFSSGQQLTDATMDLKASRTALRRASQDIAAERADERARIASALHDDVLQSLFNVTLHAQVIKEELRWGQLLALEEDVPRLLEASNEAGTLLREVIRDLRRSPIGVRGLSDTLQLLARKLREESQAEVHDDIELVECDSEQQLLIYQVAREALTNAVRHSACSEIWIALKQDGDSIRLVVRDDGTGFATDRRPTGHFGLDLMRERTASGDGDLVVESSNEGTTVTARFWLKARKSPRQGETRSRTA
jgi:signal transduction histidine kinase